ncbi:MAG: spermidine synthase, partial [Planctomycetaceae bacterium]
TVLDEGRHVATVEGRRGTLTAWTHRGSQLQIRENGVPKAIITTDPFLCPHYAPELLQAVLPMALHERPHRVLVLGLGGGEPLAAGFAFPVRELTCADADTQLPALLEARVWSDGRVRPLDDARIRIVPLDPPLAVACRGAGYDVIISCPDQSALWRASAEFTAEFYRNVARRQERDGIFCQRFHAVDYGPQPIATVAATFLDTFADVAAVEVAPGELLFLATNSPRGLSRPGIEARLKARHVRTALAQLGWDWCVPLNLPTYDHKALSEIVRQSDAEPNTASAIRSAFTLPRDLMRWGPKRQEVYDRFAQHAGRMLQWDHVDGQDPELLRRLAEVTGQRQLMAAYPDQPWAYRKTLREQLTERPRSAIRQIST